MVQDQSRARDQKSVLPCHRAKGEGQTRGAAFGLGAGALEYRVGHPLNKLARVDRVYPTFYAKEYSLSDFKIRASSILSPSCSCLLQAPRTDGLHRKGPPGPLLAWKESGSTCLMHQVSRQSLQEIRKSREVGMCC